MLEGPSTFDMYYCPSYNSFVEGGLKVPGLVLLNDFIPD